MIILYDLEYEISMKSGVDIRILKNDDVVAEIIREGKLFRLAISEPESMAMTARMIQAEDVMIWHRRLHIWMKWMSRKWKISQKMSRSRRRSVWESVEIAWQGSNIAYPLVNQVYALKSQGNWFISIWAIKSRLRYSKDSITTIFLWMIQLGRRTSLQWRWMVQQRC